MQGAGVQAEQVGADADALMLQKLERLRETPPACPDAVVAREVGDAQAVVDALQEGVYARHGRMRQADVARRRPAQEELRLEGEQVLDGNRMMGGAVLLGEDIDGQALPGADGVEERRGDVRTALA